MRQSLEATVRDAIRRGQLQADTPGFADGLAEQVEYRPPRLRGVRPAVADPRQRGLDVGRSVGEGAAAFCSARVNSRTWSGVRSGFSETAPTRTAPVTAGQSCGRGGGGPVGIDTVLSEQHLQRGAADIARIRLRSALSGGTRARRRRSTWVPNRAASAP